MPFYRQHNITRSTGFTIKAVYAAGTLSLSQTHTETHAYIILLKLCIYPKDTQTDLQKKKKLTTEQNKQNWFGPKQPEGCHRWHRGNYLWEPESIQYHTFRFQRFSWKPLSIKLISSSFFFFKNEKLKGGIRFCSHFNGRVRRPCLDLGLRSSNNHNFQGSCSELLICFCHLQSVTFSLGNFLPCTRSRFFH